MMERNLWRLPSFALLAYISAMIPAMAASITGKVESPRGAIAKAQVTLIQAGREVHSTESDSNGAFSFSQAGPGAYQLQVVAPPYPPMLRDIVVPNDGNDIAGLEIRMDAANESVTVTAGRIPMAVNTSSSDVKIKTGDELRAEPYQSLDDTLRTFPEFSFFRRASSLVAHPTTQGVSLRGIGPSGVSRSLVLLSGVPLNDAFGGWVYWDRVPLLGIQQAEIANGGQSSLYGNYGLGGVVQLLRRVPQSATFEFQGQGGSRSSRDMEFFGSHRLGPWGFSASGSFFDFDGYPVINRTQRGRVDIPAYSSHQAMRFSTEYAPLSSSFLWTLDGGYLNENRGNGTPLTPNDTDSFDMSTGVQWSPTPHDQIEAHTFFRRTIFAGNFSAVAAGRNTERLTTQQHVPSADGGGAITWYATRGKNRIASGGDFWLVSGLSRENAFAVNGTVNALRLGGGKQSTVGLFLQDSYAVSSRLTLTVGGRLDFWRNYDGRFGSLPPTSTALAPRVVDTSKTVFSPSGGFTFDATSDLALYGSIYRSFRAPTLNELYRGFSVGNVITNPNAVLTPEHSIGGEVGTRIKLTNELHLDIASFINRLSDPVSNVTQQITATQIIRQRQNLGAARIYGMQSTLSWKPITALKLEAFYLWDRAVVTDFKGRPGLPDPGLVGKRLPQVPEHRANFSADIIIPQGVVLSLNGRVAGKAYDDDLNALVLNRYFQLDANITKSIGESARVFVALENLTDAKIIVTRSPVDFIGTPFMVRGGVFISLGRHGSR